MDAPANRLEKTVQVDHYCHIRGVASLNFTWILDERRSKRVPRQGSLRGFRLQSISPKATESEGLMPLCVSKAELKVHCSLFIKYCCFDKKIDYSCNIPHATSI
jgi:hypothetical protein